MSKEIEGIVDISDKAIVKREAVATGLLILSNKAIQAIKSGSVKKGDVQ